MLFIVLGFQPAFSFISFEKLKAIPAGAKLVLFFGPIIGALALTLTKEPNNDP